MDPSDQNQTRVTVTKNVDRISTLPDDVICDRILSLLPTIDSVRTSALSTQWKHLYASVPVLKFINESRNLTQPDPNAFAGFVSKVLNTVTNKLSRVSKLTIYLNLIPVSSSDIISWIETATSHSVQKLNVYGLLVECAPLATHCLFTCETLVSLCLDIGFVLSVPDKVCLPNLKNLHLGNIIFGGESDDESVRRLFSSCPVLEQLMVASNSKPPNACVFSVSNPSLKYLELRLNHPIIEISINCQNLEELVCFSYAVRGYSGGVLGSLKKCHIDAGLYGDQPFEQGKLIELARQVCKVPFLSLAGTSMQTLLVPTGSLPIFKNLTTLELESDTIIGWRLLPTILDSSPRLETLDLAKGFFDKDDYFANPYSPPGHVPTCLSFHLKVIKIGIIGEEEEYKWVEFFLTNALVLEKMEIRLLIGGGSKFERHFEISRRLLSYQRSSKVCQIVLPHPYY